MLIPCRECRESISDRAGWCPHCGMPTEAATPVNANVRSVPARDSHTARKVFGGIVALGLVLFIGYGLLKSGFFIGNVLIAVNGLLLTAILVELP